MKDAPTFASLAIAFSRSMCSFSILRSALLCGVHAVDSTCSTAAALHAPLPLRAAYGKDACMQACMQGWIYAQ